jgi:hypothetical protein
MGMTVRARIRTLPRFARRARRLVLLTAAAAALVVQGCTIQSIALRSVDSLFDNTVTALMRESDLQFAETAIPGDLKLLEAVSDSDPTNVRYNQLACMGFASYALAFTEDDPSRAVVFYSRARDYGERGMIARGIPRAAFAADAATMTAALGRLSRSDLPLVFWTASAWGSAASLQLNEPDSLAAIPTVNAMMEWVQAREPGYFYGGPSLYFGVYYGSFPPALGGKPALAKENFDRAHEASGGKFLMTDVLYARIYAVGTQDRQLFVDLLTRVVDAPSDMLPEQGLANSVAKKRARELLARTEELF